LSYSHTTFGSLCQALANRLGDPASIYWRNAAYGDELSVYIFEALRTWQAYTAFARGRCTFNLLPGNTWYDISDSGSTGSGPQNPAALLGPTVTDSLVVQSIQYHLIENADQQVNGKTWVGTEMFTLADVTAALQRALNQFIQDTGCKISTLSLIGPTPSDDLVLVPDTIIDIRRVGWIETLPGIPFYGYATPANSGDNQHFSLPTYIDPSGFPLFLNGQLQALASDYILTGVNLTFPLPLTGVWNLQGFAGIGNFVPLVDSGDHQNFMLPSGPLGVCQVFLNGLLLAIPGDYSILGPTVTLTSALSGVWNIQAFIGSGRILTITDSGDHQHFTLSAFPTIGGCFQLFENGQLLQPGLGLDYTISGMSVTFPAPLSGSWNLQAFDWYPAPIVKVTPLWRSSAFSATAFQPQYNVTPGTPKAFEIVTQSPLSFRLIPAPVASGSLDLLVTSAGPTLNPTTGVVLGILDNLSPAVKWGALADLLAQDGPAKDLKRSAYCQQRYQEFVEISRITPVIIQAKIQGVNCQIGAVEDADSFYPTWQIPPSGVRPPKQIISAGLNLIAPCPLPDTAGPYSITLDIVTNANVPISNAAFVQLGREQLDAILDEAQHLACLKMGGDDFEGSISLHENFVREAAIYNDRLLGSSTYIQATQGQSQRQATRSPRRESDVEVTV